MKLIMDRDYINIMNLLGEVLRKYGISTSEVQELKHKIHTLIVEKLNK